MGWLEVERRVCSVKGALATGRVRMAQHEISSNRSEARGGGTRRAANQHGQCDVGIEEDEEGVLGAVPQWLQGRR